MLLSLTDGKLKRKRKMKNQKKKLKPVPTMSQQILRLELTKEVPNNPPTMETILTQHQMLSGTSSLTLTLVKANGGRLHSIRNTGLLKSGSSTEEIAVEADCQALKSLLTINSVDLSQEVLKMDSGTM
jgi:hypothetical protein